jgi:hypothetical protein
MLDMIFMAELMISFDFVPNWFWSSLQIDKYCVNIRDNKNPNLWNVMTEIYIVFLAFI